MFNNVDVGFPVARLKWVTGKISGESEGGGVVLTTLHTECHLVYTTWVLDLEARYAWLSGSGELRVSGSGTAHHVIIVLGNELYNDVVDSPPAYR